MSARNASTPCGDCEPCNDPTPCDDSTPCVHMSARNASAPCGYCEPPIVLAHDSQTMPAPARRLTLTRTQRRGTPIMARGIIAEIAGAKRPAELRDALDRLIGHAGIMSRACYRRGWPLAGNCWRGAAVVARRMQEDGRPRNSVNRWLVEAERHMYKAANETGESGGRARTRRKQ